MIKQFEVGKSYYRELPSNPNFAVVIAASHPA